ncbi:MAG: UDP-N-acetylmuramate dehydrogenase, partial [Acidobacteriota bacterium]|nr:UDP-N-acetylmuramate dehydrogenase [Acidobacteriota bacterium]
MEIRENVGLAAYTTLGIGGAARYFVEAKTEADASEAVAWTAARDVPLFLLGGGSNLLVADEGFGGLVLHMAIAGIEADGEGAFDVGAGESWDAFVSRAIGMGCAGIECLAGVPGSVGGTPVQNVGAYGQEVAESIVSVRAFDRRSGEFVELANADCGFRYRESLFNTSERGRYIVTRVRFALRSGGPPCIEYKDLQRRFAAHASPTLAQVADAVREIRLSKGMLIVPGDADSRSAGSFFKNPIVAKDTLTHVAGVVRVGEGKVPHWKVGDGRVKISAAWLLERAGFVKGYGSGPVRISSRHTLALTNRGSA